MIKSFRKAFLVITMCGLLLMTMVPMQAMGSEALAFPDLQGHWAADYINRWSSLGLLGNYPDGSFGPSRLITRAEFLTYVNRAFNYTKAAEVGFSDVSGSDEYAAAVATAVTMGYATGKDDGSFGPNEPISRLEAASMLYRVLRLEPVADNYLADYQDTDELQNADREMVNSLVDGGYLRGYEDDTLRMKNSLTRAEGIVFLARAAGEIMNVAATFGPDQGVQTINGNATINRTGIVLQNTTITGDLYITEGVGEGSFYLQNVNVLGRTIVAGGGSRSGEVTGTSHLARLTFAYSDGTTHVVFYDQASPGTVDFHAAGSLDTSRSSSSQRPCVNIGCQVPPGTVVTVVGSFDALIIDAAGVAVEMGEGATANQVQVTENAEGATLNINAKVGSVNLCAANCTVNIGSPGSTDAVNVADEAIGSSINIRGEVQQLQTSAQIEVSILSGGSLQQMRIDQHAAGTAVHAAGDVSIPNVDAPENIEWSHSWPTPPSSPPASDPDEPTRTSVSSVRITGDAIVGATLTAVTSPANAKVNYRWERADGADGGYQPISGATSAAYRLSAVDVGGFFRVRVTGIGRYRGTQFSAAIGAVEPGELAVCVTEPYSLNRSAPSLAFDFQVEDLTELAWLEIDHSLQGILPEFKLYPVDDNPWRSPACTDQEAAQRQVAAQSLGAYSSYDPATRTWTLIFSESIGEGTALATIKQQSAFELYYVVEDVYGNKFGSMNPTTPENTVAVTVYDWTIEERLNGASGFLAEFTEDEKQIYLGDAHLGFTTNYADVARAHGTVLSDALVGADRDVVVDCYYVSDDGAWTAPPIRLTLQALAGQYFKGDGNRSPLNQEKAKSYYRVKVVSVDGISVADLPEHMTIEFAIEDKAMLDEERMRALDTLIGSVTIKSAPLEAVNAADKDTMQGALESWAEALQIEVGEGSAYQGLANHAGLAIDRDAQLYVVESICDYRDGFSNQEFASLVEVHAAFVATVEYVTAELDFVAEVSLGNLHKTTVSQWRDALAVYDNFLDPDMEFFSMFYEILGGYLLLSDDQAAQVSDFVLGDLDEAQRKNHMLVLLKLSEAMSTPLWVV